MSSVVSATIKEEPIKTKPVESDDTISISRTSTDDQCNQYGVTEVLNMTVCCHQQLLEGYSQLVAAIPKLAPGEIIKPWHNCCLYPTGLYGLCN